MSSHPNADPLIRRPAIRLQVILWATVLTFVLLNLIPWLVWGLTYRAGARLVVERDRALTRLQAQRLATLMSDYADSLIALAARPDLYAGNLSAGQAVLNSPAADCHAFDGGLALLNREGRVIAAAEPLRFALGQNWADRPYAQPVTATAFRYSNLLNPAPSGGPVLALAVPVDSPYGPPMTLIGMLRLDEDAPFYTALSREMRGREGGNLYLLDGVGQVIYPPATYLGQESAVQVGVRQVLAGQSGAMVVRRSAGGKALIALAPVDGTPWVVVSETDWTVWSVFPRHLLYAPIAVWLFGLLASFAMGMLGIQQIVRPLDTLMAVVRQAAESDLSRQFMVESGGDLRELAAQAKRMAARLHELYTSLDQRVCDRTRELSVLYQVATVARTSLDLDETLARSLDQALVVMACEIGMVHLLDQESESLRLAAWRGIPTTGEIQRRVDLDEQELIVWVFEQAGPVNLLHLADSPRPLRVFAAPGECPYVGVPMRTPERTVGVLSLIGAAGRQFAADECALLAAIADQIAVTVENVRLRAEAEQVALLQERERLARDLHDSVTQSLYSLTLWIEAGQRSLRAGDLAHVEEYLDRLEEGTRQAIRDMRLLVYELRPPALEEEGLVGALQERLDAVEKRSGIQAQLVVEGKIELPPKVEEGLYRIAQEALNNALKHAAASTVSVRLHTQADAVTLEIVDNGIGFDRDGTDDTGGMGLANMQQRAIQLGGTLSILSWPGKGTHVRAVIPSSRTRLAAQMGEGQDG